VNFRLQQFISKLLVRKDDAISRDIAEAYRNQPSGVIASAIGSVARDRRHGIGKVI
jgi:hypothetical protein